jgi:hypothetical protein
MRRLWTALVILSACKQPSDAGPASFEPALSARELWSGGELRISEAYFREAAPVVMLGGDTLPSRRVDDTTFVLRLPRRAGAYPVRVVAGRLAQSLGDVTLHGYQSATNSTTYMSGQPYWLPGSGAPLVMAGSDPGAGVFDLRTGTAVVSFPESLYSPDCIWSPSPSYRIDRFIFIGKQADGRCGLPKLWTITSAPQLIDSISCCSYTWYTSGQPSPRRWVFNWNNHNNFYICDTTPCSARFFNSGDGPNGVTISPRGDRFLWLPAYRPVVFDSRTLDTAYVIPGIIDPQGAFSFDGDTLALTAIGESAPYSKHIMLLRAAGGSVLRDMQVDTLFGESFWGIGAVAFDPVQPWLYATAFVYSPTDSSYRNNLIVVDRSTWSIIGVLESPNPSKPTLFHFQAMAVVPSPLEHLVYVVSAANGYSIRGYQGVIYRYSTP